MSTRTYEQKKALVEKWFTKEQLAAFQSLRLSPVLAKVHGHSSSDLFTPVAHALPEIADEKENIMELTEAFVRDQYDSHYLFLILDCMQDRLTKTLCEENDEFPESRELTKREIADLVNTNFDFIELLKVLTSIGESADRIKFFERRIALAEAGISE